MHRRGDLEAEYHRILRECGLPVPDTHRNAHERLDVLVNESLETAVSEGAGWENVISDVADPAWRAEFIRRAQESPGMKPVLDVLSAEVIESARSVGLQSREPVLVREFPTGSFNAQATKVSGGVLLLINTGLMMFLYQTLKVMTFSMGFAEFDTSGRPIDGSIRHGPSLGGDEIAEALAEIVLAYLLLGDSAKARRFPLQGGAKGMVQGLLVRACEKFVIAHEYGHVVAGHFDNAKTRKARTPIAEIGLIEKTWKQEHEADTIATHLLLASAPLFPDEPWRSLEIQSHAAGVLLFFAMDQLITSVVTEISGLDHLAVVSDHPPSSDRASLQREFLDRAGGERLLTVADVCVGWVAHLHDQVITLIGRYMSDLDN
jgi:hypothetical protein